MKKYINLFDQIASLENLVIAWEEFRNGKGKKFDVQAFEYFLEQNLFSLHRDLISKNYSHGPYSGFYIRDPKVRHIHKAEARDRVLHHAMFRILNPLFEESFIANSFSCRIGKGTHKGVLAAEKMICQESQNYTKLCFVLKCDVKKFFDSVDHEILLAILRKRIIDSDAIWLLEQIVRSFPAGLPIGNLTSQLFANIYMNEFDQFVKHKLKIKHYARYTDDFIVASADKEYLNKLVHPFQEFLQEKLKLSLHPQKCSILNIRRGVDFLGYAILPHYRLMRNKTKRRIFRKLKFKVMQYRMGRINEDSLSQSLQSYLGVLSHAQTFQLSQDLRNQYWYWICE